MTALLLGLFICHEVSADVSQPGPPLEELQQRVVKVYGATVGAVKGYGAGVTVSADGQVVTALSAMLEGASLRVVTADGRVYPARVTRRDDVRQLALLKVDAADWPHFALLPQPDSNNATTTSATPFVAAGDVATGDWVLALANPFKVADGPEPLSVAQGVISGRATLAARARTQDITYTGEVWLTDIIVATPGSAGGALVTFDGRFVGLIGKPLLSRKTNTWLNYALPAGEIAAFLRGETLAVTRPAPTGKPLVDLGIKLFDVGGRKRLAFVERVRPGSPAARAGLRADDLIIAVGGQSVEVVADVVAALVPLELDDGVELLIKRGEEVVSITIAGGGDLP